MALQQIANTDISSTGTFALGSISSSALTSGRVTYATTGGLLTDSSSLTYDGTTLTSTKFAGALNGTVGATTPSTVVATSVTNSGLTSGRITYASTGGLLVDSANLVFTGTNVGIGTASPAAKLDLGGNTASTVQQIFGRGVTDTDFTVRYTNGAAGTSAFIGTLGLDYANGTFADMATIKFYRNSVAGELAFFASASGVSGTEKLRITSTTLHTANGISVGIGTDSPYGLLNIKGSNGQLVLANGNTSGGMKLTASNSIYTGNGYLAFEGYANEYGRFDSSGNFGIGITNPTAKLTVKGQTHTAPWFAAERNGSTTLQFKIVGAENTGYTASTGTVSAPWTNVIDNNNSDLMLSTVLSGGTGGNIILDGKVGIGTTSPSRKLQSTINVATAYSSSDFDTASNQLYLTNTNTTTNSFTGIQMDVGGNSQAAISAVRVGDGEVAMTFGTRVAGSRAERMRIDSSGNVGIGTSSPAFLTEIVGGATTVETTLFQVRSNAGGIGTGSTIAFGNSTNASAGSGRVELAGIRDTASGSSFVIRTADSSGTIQNRVKINESGNVGIGTSSPTSPTGFTTNRTLLQITNASDTGQLVLGSTANGLMLDYSNSTGDVTIRNGYGATSGNALLNINSGTLVFKTGTSYTERMRIDSSGNLLVGGTVTDPITSKVSGATVTPSTTCFRVYSDVSNACAMGVTSTGSALVSWYYNGANFVGSVTTNGTGVTYGTASDYRLKENVASMTGALAKVAQLKPVTYKWKSDGSDGQGFIAHELQAVVPDCVNGKKDAVDEDGNIKPQSVDTSFLVATLVSAIQEQQALIESMATKLKDAGVAGF